ncbi:MAG TPA: hypothetical protein VNA19_07820 [Pyrinomonadaceae bacterium]|jgi:hypothetical protein|nr:hypothetical protein [Pyrinomonadaceae bacterium]
MSDRINLDEVRTSALDRIERSERNFKLTIYLATLWEALFLGAFILAADFSDRLHLLLLIATVGSYSLVVLGIVALGAYMNRSLLRVVKAVELLKS